MIKTFKKSYLMLGAAISTAVVFGFAGDAAAVTNLDTLSTNIGASLTNLPGIFQAIAYLIGTILAILGIIKIKEHVEKPDQTPLREGAVRLIMGGALLALPSIMVYMKDSAEGDGIAGEAVAAMKKVKFSIVD